MTYVVSKQILKATNKIDIKDKPCSSYKNKNKDI